MVAAVASASVAAVAYRGSIRATARQTESVEGNNAATAYLSPRPRSPAAAAACAAAFNTDIRLYPSHSIYRFTFAMRGCSDSEV